MTINQPLNHDNQLKLKRLGIDTYKEAVVYMRRDCHICQSEGFEVHARVAVTIGKKTIFATLNHISNKAILRTNEASLSEYAWKLLDANEGDIIELSHARPLQSLSDVRSKIYGHSLSDKKIHRIVEDISHGRYSDMHVAAFLTACAGGRLNQDEIISLTKAMTSIGEQLSWNKEMIVDKHCVGGLPGNRITLIIVPIVTAFGMIMPKTSSRAITSPAGTADTMETLAPVNLDLASMHRVVEQENGCIVWGGSVNLSPADDVLIRVERAIDLDSEGQLIASVLSKKIAAGSTHVVIDMPVGDTAKVRSTAMADSLEQLFLSVAAALGITLKIVRTDGSQPVGRGIGPALEAKDVLAVLQNKADAPKDLRDRALMLAGLIIEFSSAISKGEGIKIAKELLDSGKAWKKFQAICDAQGGLREPPHAAYTHTITALDEGRISCINNRDLARLAKLAGAPLDKTAGVFLHTSLGVNVKKNQPLYSVHASSKGALRYALSLLDQVPPVIQVDKEA